MSWHWIVSRSIYKHWLCLRRTHIQTPNNIYICITICVCIKCAAYRFRYHRQIFSSEFFRLIPFLWVVIQCLATIRLLIAAIFSSLGANLTLSKFKENILLSRYHSNSIQFDHWCINYRVQERDNTVRLKIRLFIINFYLKRRRRRRSKLIRLLYIPLEFYTSLCDINQTIDIIKNPIGTILQYLKASKIPIIIMTKKNEQIIFLEYCLASSRFEIDCVISINLDSVSAIKLYSF